MLKSREELEAEFPLQKITMETWEKAQSVLKSLKNPDRYSDSHDIEYIMQLSSLIQDFEEETSSKSVLGKLISEGGFKTKKFAKWTGIRHRRIRKILNGEKTLKFKELKKLVKTFDTSFEVRIGPA